MKAVHNFNYHIQNYKTQILLVLTVAFIAILPVLSRLVDEQVPRIEVVFFRYFLGFFCLSFFALFWMKLDNLSGKDIFTQTIKSFSALQIARVIVGMVSLFFLFYSAAHMEVLALKSMTYIAPMFASVFSFIFLKDKITKSMRVSFMLVLLGLAVYFRPWEIGFTFDLAFYSIMLYAVFAGLENLFVKMLSHKYHGLAILFFVNFCASIILFSVSVPQFVIPSGRNFIFLFLLALCSILTQLCYLYVVKRVQLTLLMSFSYTGIIFSAIYGETIFHETPDIYQIAGCSIIMLSGLVTVLFGLKHKNLKPVSQNS